ncbi:hypothetical protein M0Q50_09145 [bacterium]|jgi:hypothetical protein|nr:hypothetical protein [bacterium]
MKKKINISISVSPILFDIIDKNFDNKSELLEWFIKDFLSKNDELKI